MVFHEKHGRDSDIKHNWCIITQNKSYFLLFSIPLLSVSMCFHFLAGVFPREQLSCNTEITSCTLSPLLPPAFTNGTCWFKVYGLQRPLEADHPFRAECHSFIFRNGKRTAKGFWCLLCRLPTNKQRLTENIFNNRSVKLCTVFADSAEFICALLLHSISSLNYLIKRWLSAIHRP